MLNSLERDDLLSKLLSFSCILDCLIEGPLGHPNALGTHPGSGSIKRPHGHDKSHSFFSNEVFFWNKAILEDQFPCGRRPDPHLLLFLPKIEAGGPLFDDESARTSGALCTIGHGDNGIDLCLPAVGDPLFGSVQKIPLSLPGSGRSYGTRITSCIRLRQPKGSQPFPPGNRREILFLLLRASKKQDGHCAQAACDHTGCDPEADSAQFLCDQTIF